MALHKPITLLEGPHSLHLELKDDTRMIVKTIDMKNSAMERATEMLCASHLHRSIWLPATEQHERLRVTYSLTSNFSDAQAPAVLFCGPLFGSRYINIMFDNLAKAASVRVICVDRPGMGGSTRVPHKQRIRVWLETVPVLLEHLQVQYVSLMSHSAGTLYALNTLDHLPHILDPKMPFVAFMCPWVHFKHSGMTMLNVAAKLPDGMLDSWNSVAKFVSTKVAPSVSWSAGIVSPLSGLFQGTGADDKERELVEMYDTDVEVAQKLEKLQATFFFAEDTTGANEEARLCLKSMEDSDWLSCTDYAQYVVDLISKEQNCSREESRLKVRVYYAESDAMIGTRGQAYFEQCWHKDKIGEAFSYESKTLPGTDHDSVLTDIRKGALKGVFDEIATLRLTQ